MKVIIKTKEANISMPVPLTMAEMAVKAVPDSVFRKAGSKLGKPYDCLVSREMISMIFSECRGVFKQCRGLEILHIEGHDGTYVSIRV